MDLTTIHDRLQDGPRLCSFGGCKRKHIAKGLCTVHYSRKKKGKPLDDWRDLFIQKNPPNETEGYIPLNPKMFAVVDRSDFDTLMKFKWHARKQRGGFVYAVRKMLVGGKERRVKMHNDIAIPPEGFVVDHRDHDTMNNRRSNLRVCTSGENSRNGRKCIKESTSKYKGVCFHKTQKKWGATISFNGRQRHLGMFDDEEDAAIHYNVAAQLCYGEYACLNPV